jgi:hypothetical protein
MSTIHDAGRNISLSVKVLRETYKNLSLLFNEMDAIGQEQGFIPLLPKFLRWKSDNYEDAWLLRNMIKLYQMEGESAGNDNLPDLKDGDIFAVEIDLEGEEEYPEMTVSRFRFDLTKWNRLPSIADHWLFWEPYRYDNHFVIEQDADGLWRSRTKEKSVPRYWGLKEAVGVTFPLTSVYNADTIRTELFGSMLRLPDLRSFNEPDHR